MGDRGKETRVIRRTTCGSHMHSVGAVAKALLQAWGESRAPRRPRTTREDARTMRFTIFKRIASGYVLIMLMVVFMRIYVTLKLNQLTEISYKIAKVDG